MPVIASNPPLFPAQSPRRELSKRLTIILDKNKKKSHCCHMHKLLPKKPSAHVSNKPTLSDRSVKMETKTSSNTCESEEMQTNRRFKSTECVVGRQESVLGNARFDSKDRKTLSKSQTRLITEKRTEKLNRLVSRHLERSLGLATLHRDKLARARANASPNDCTSRIASDYQKDWSCSSSKSSRYNTMVKSLHSEIVHIASQTKKTVDSMKIHIAKIIENVTKSVQELWHDSTIETFGSYSTGLWLPTSDVDLVILNVLENCDLRTTVANLGKLADVLSQQDWVASIVVLETAKVPVIKLVSKDVSIPIDISFETSSTHSGLLARDLVSLYVKELPELYPAAIIMKQLLRERDLNDAYTGGLSSYSIVLMLIHFSLLRRHGRACFEAAAVYASGGLPSSAHTSIEDKRSKISTHSSWKELFTDHRTQQVRNPTTDHPADSHDSECGSRRKLSDVSKRSQKGLKRSSSRVDHNDRSVSETDDKSYAKAVLATPKKESATIESTPTESKGQSWSKCSYKPASTPFSYAAVAAGKATIAKTPAAGHNCKNQKNLSYASIVSAPAKPKSGSHVSISSADFRRALRDIDVSTDAISVTSSSADTEDSSCSCKSQSSEKQPESLASLKREHGQKEEDTELGRYIYEFLEFFGLTFDYRKNGLSIRDGGYIYRLAEFKLAGSQPALVIEDPIHPDSNVSSSSFAFPRVVALFEDLYYALSYHRPTRFTPSVLSCLLMPQAQSTKL
uniref:Uncharacterized protein AlNc14C46G3701 n=1 Tax=Albugo laibachii Nc14 TaxID=890382 RepID=F0WAH5_9STRA|nr:conserved hypothetical protein [Albugo laibachii Nc14]|eukprot:CCA18146.1 conserved hypothetical protein [Albugo laibachii Nc14]